MERIDYTIKTLVPILGGALILILWTNPSRAESCFLRQELTSRTSGILASVEKSENSPVSPGDVILTLDDRILVVGLKEAEAALLMARSQENLAKDAFDRVASLKGGDSVSKQQVVESNLRLAQARAGVAQAMAVVERLKIQIADTKIKAEIAGVVRGLPRVKGLFVQFGQFLGYVETTADVNQIQKGNCSGSEKIR